MDKKDVLKRYRKMLKNRTETVYDFKESGNAEMMNAAKTLERDRDEFELIVESLEEQVSREHGCEYCGSGNDKEWAECWTVGTKDGYDRLVTIQYCPMCGRKLNA
jgi:hypothetical protein